MKKTLVAVALTLMSASALASNPVLDRNDTSVLEVAYTDNEFSKDVNADGLRLDVWHELNQSAGMHLRHDYMSFDSDETDVDVDGNLTLLGVTYELPLNVERLSVTPEIGVSHVRFTGSSSETAIYGGVTANVEIVDNAFYGQVFARAYDDKVVENTPLDSRKQLGAKLTYKLDRDISFNFGVEKFGEMKTLSLGLGFTF